MSQRVINVDKETKAVFDKKYYLWKSETPGNNLYKDYIMYLLKCEDLFQNGSVN